MKLLFIDTETSGLDPTTHGIVQIAGIIEIDGEIKEKFNFKCQLFEGQTINADALKANKLTVEQIREFPDPLPVYKKLVAIFRKYIDQYNKVDKFYMVGQNVPFDYAFLEKFFKNCGDNYLYAYIFYDKIDLVALTAAFRVSKLLTLENVRLETVAKHFGIQYVAHDAEADIEVTREIFYRFVNYLKKDSHPVFDAIV